MSVIAQEMLWIGRDLSVKSRQKIASVFVELLRFAESHLNMRYPVVVQLVQFFLFIIIHVYILHYSAKNKNKSLDKT